MKTVTAIIDGAAIQLASRLEVRRELTNASATPTKIADGTPRNKTLRNVKTSPAVKLEVVLGMRIGFAPATITSKSKPPNVAHCIVEKARQRWAAQTNSMAPAATITNQQVFAARL